MDIYDDMERIRLEIINIRSELDDLEIIKDKLEHIEDFLINYTRGNYIRHLKRKDTQ